MTVSFQSFLSFTEPSISRFSIKVLMKPDTALLPNRAVELKKASVIMSEAITVIRLSPLE